MSAWGDIPTWITTLAVGFGAYQLFQDRQARQRQAEAEARTQASAVSAWAGSFRAPQAQLNDYGFVITNDSGLPFRDVEVDVTIHGRAYEGVQIMILPAGNYFVELINNGEWDYATSLEEYSKPVRPYTRTARYRVDAVRFTDALGCRWALDEAGGLTRVTLVAGKESQKAPAQEVA